MRTWPSPNCSQKRRQRRPREISSARADSAGLKSLARTAKDEAEAQAITRALEQTNWNRKQAAAILQISYKALLYKIRQYGIAEAKGHHKLSAGAYLRAPTLKDIRPTDFLIVGLVPLHVQRNYGPSE